MRKSSMEDLREVLATTPTEARYSWVVHKSNGYKNYEGTSSRFFQRRDDRDRNLTSPRSSMRSPYSYENTNERVQPSAMGVYRNEERSPIASRNSPLIFENDNKEVFKEHRSPVGSLQGSPPQVLVRRSTQEEILDEVKESPSIITNGREQQEGNLFLLHRPNFPKRVSFSDTEEIIEGLPPKSPVRPNSSLSNAASREKNTNNTEPTNESSIQNEESDSPEISHRKRLFSPPTGTLASPPNSGRTSREDSANNNEDPALFRSGNDNVALRVFGNRYNLTKGHVKSFRSSTEHPPVLAGNNPHDLIAEYQYKNSRLQEELNSSNKKIQKLNKINQNALKRKEELQKEVLDAYKKISDLEIERNAMNNQQKQLEVEIKTTKQRLNDSEREAASAIGKCTKLERSLQDAEMKRSKYFEDLAHAERRISKLENLLKEIDEEHTNETEERKELHRKLFETESSLKLVVNENKTLQAKHEIAEKENKLHEAKLTKESQEKQNLEIKNSELLKLNTALKDDVKRLEGKYGTIQRNLDQSSAKAIAQKEKFDLASKSKSNIEVELREIQQQLSKEKIQRQKLNTEYRIKSEQFNYMKATKEDTKRLNDELQKENRTLKDKVLYLELYQQINENKTKVIPNSGNSQKGNFSLDKPVFNRKHYLFDTLEQIKTRRNQQLTFQNLNDETKCDKKSFEKSRRSRDRSRCNSVRKQSGSSIQTHRTATPDLYDINDKIERIQNDRNFYVSKPGSVLGSSRNPSARDTARDTTRESARSENEITPVSSIAPDYATPPTEQSEEEEEEKEEEEEEEEEPSSNLPSFGDELKSEDEIEVENLVNFSDLLQGDIASALM